ncbi:DMT family transporter [Paracoccus sp. 1_MG-2023]|uniref:DMT family transporter n=1 Tax=unclassified Paracoccus (in: a-proteobacteria) TaxID=2688777 RepID=UPI001C083710|nr:MULTISPECIES: DMT family transporter [unclassified Paracoccus (in: a-proteobacteria)]MBU2957173.1 DMT family transporter [Paracoccus sp. C2R09]MDO6669060.1 DMT family transporter [Paracoccus sp. 1_MG-2023]
MVPANVRGALLQLTAMGIFATHDVVIKTLGQTYPPLQILFFSSMLSFPLISMILMRDPNSGTLRPNSPWWVMLRAGCGIAAGMGGFFAFSTLPLAQVYAILFTTPLLITILSIPVLGEKVGIHRWAAVVVGLSGVLIVLRPGPGQDLQLGHAAALLSAFAGAIAAVTIRRLGRSERPLVLMMWPMLGNFMATGVSLAFAYRPMELQHLGLAGVIACLGLMGGFLVILAYRAGEAAIVAPMQYSQILWATAYGWFLFGEALDLPTLLGACVIIASGIYIVIREASGASVNRPATTSRLRSETVTAPKSTVLQRLFAPRR